MLTGLIYCKNCDSKYTFVKGYKNTSYAICRNKKIYGTTICNSRNIKEKILNEKILSSLKDIFSKYANKEYILNNLEYRNKNKNKNKNKLKENLLQEKNKLELKVAENNNIKFNLYKDKINNVISEKDYIDFSNKLSEIILNLESNINNITHEIEGNNVNYNSKEKMLNLVDNFLKTKIITRNDILQLIDKIEIDTQGNKIKTYFKFNI